jgi:hypothetical protein
MKTQIIRARLCPTVMSGLVLRVYLNGDEIANASRDGVGVRAFAVILPHDTAWYQVLMHKLVEISLALASHTSTWSDLEKIVAGLPEWARVERSAPWHDSSGREGTELEVVPEVQSSGFIRKASIEA